MRSDDRPAAVLTPSQREVLTGDSDLTDRGERSARARIRERLQASIHDLELLRRHGDPDDLLKNVDSRELERTLPETVAFINLLCESAGLEFDDVVDEGVELAKGNRVEVIRARFESGDRSVTLGELGLLVGEGGIDAEAFKSQLGERVAEGSGMLSELSNSEQAGRMLAELLLTKYDPEAE